MTHLQYRWGSAHVRRQKTLPGPQAGGRAGQLWGLATTQSLTRRRLLKVKVKQPTPKRFFSDEGSGSGVRGQPPEALAVLSALLPWSHLALWAGPEARRGQSARRCPGRTPRRPGEPSGPSRPLLGQGTLCKPGAGGLSPAPGAPSPDRRPAVRAGSSAWCPAKRIPRAWAGRSGPL